MLVQVKVPYYDLKSNNEVRKVGEVLDYADGKRGEELVNKGFVTPISIIKVGEVRKTSTKK